MNTIDARELTQGLRNDGLGALADAVEKHLERKYPRTEQGKQNALADAIESVMCGPDCEAREQIFRRVRASGIGPRSKPVDTSVN